MAPTVLESSPLDKEILNLVERKDGLTISQITVEIKDYDDAEVKDAVWGLLADRLLRMSSDRTVARNQVSRTDES